MTSPSFLHAFFPYRLSIASNAVSQVIARAYQALFGIGIAEWRVLAVVAESAGMTSGEVVVATRMDKVGVSRAVATLVARGLIERGTRTDDRRSHRLTLSPAGIRLHAQVVPEAIALEAQLLAGLTVEEVAQLADLLGRLTLVAETIGQITHRPSHIEPLGQSHCGVRAK